MKEQLPIAEQTKRDRIFRYTPPSHLHWKKPILFGLTSLSAFLMGFVYWGATAQLESAAIAYGDLSVISKRQKVQHLEGGIIASIHVHEGDRVEEGQLLIKLSGQHASAKWDSMNGLFIHTVAKENRLSSELDNLGEISWSPDLENLSSEEILREAKLVQSKIFEARKRFFDSKLNIIAQSMSGANLELDNLTNTKKIERERLQLIEEEIRSNQSLVQRGYAGKSALLQLKRMATEVKSTLSQLDRQSLTVQKRLDENQARIEELRLERLNEIVAELRETQKDIVTVREELRLAKDTLDRTNIAAPISGRVVNMQVFTEKGVINSGDTLLELVPLDDELLVEAQVNPEDIDLVSTGQSAHVRLTALNARTLAPLNGTVLTVSADKLTNQQEQDYYLARIALNQEDVESYKLTSGMNAEVLILSEPRTPLSYLLKPLTESMNRAFRED
ncbi:Membrane fusion protein (MFP) family protein [Vibrio rotiferianus]|uniref:HlyD family type I secretion periplasmic adaptor subunit n=1 Tax=Vibrio rotiferianus TaxID=190895 RepID=UPI0028955A91|nr:Membrane fusion protein (MFP) family protein [Vibrio rotiferianus]